MADKINHSRFLAPPPVIIPPNASMAERIKLRYGPAGPPIGSKDAHRLAIAGDDPDARAAALKSIQPK